MVIETLEIFKSRKQMNFIQSILDVLLLTTKTFYLSKHHLAHALFMYITSIHFLTFIIGPNVTICQTSFAE